MKNLKELDHLRDLDSERKSYNGPNPEPASCGVFRMTQRELKGLLIIATSAGGWDHVSVSRKDRCPTWEEMELIKRIFFERDECAMQLHVPVKEHINNHPYCLHIWRPLYEDIPRPPAQFVGIQKLGVLP